MDIDTIGAYDKSSRSYADDWRNQPAPSDMYALLEQYFQAGKTVDVGCGAGRDVAWLSEHGFDAIGVDGSTGLLNEARETYPHIPFSNATLPAALRAAGRRISKRLVRNRVDASRRH